jgi:hypothetical protein
MRLMERADIHQIAKNCRMSVEMIENFYVPTLRTGLMRQPLTCAIRSRQKRGATIPRRPKTMAQVPGNSAGRDCMGQQWVSLVAAVEAAHLAEIRAGTMPLKPQRNQHFPVPLAKPIRVGYLGRDFGSKMRRTKQRTPACEIVRRKDVVRRHYRATPA